MVLFFVVVLADILLEVVLRFCEQGRAWAAHGVSPSGWDAQGNPVRRASLWGKGGEE